jgi:hypothetical protein
MRLLGRARLGGIRVSRDLEGRGPAVRFGRTRWQVHSRPLRYKSTGTYGAPPPFQPGPLAQTVTRDHRLDHSR